MDIKSENIITVKLSKKEIKEAICHYLNANHNIGYKDVNFHKSEIDFHVDVDKHFHKNEKEFDDSISATVTVKN